MCSKNSITHSVPGSSPIKRSTQGSYVHNSKLPTAEKVRKEMAEEMEGLWVGPMPVQLFLDEFVPVERRTRARTPPRLNSQYFNEMPRRNKEVDMYQDFIDLVERHDIIPGYKIVNTSAHPDHNSRKGRKIKPDPTMYRNEVDTSEKVTQFDKIELHFEFKISHDADPFQDIETTSNESTQTKYPFEAEAKPRTLCRGQLTSYVTEWCTRQHRRFAFSVFVGDPFVRFIRWERSGAIVSARFNFRENSRPLIDFLWRFVHLSDRQRGLDDTVRPATEAEVKLAEKHLSSWKNKLERPVIVFMIRDNSHDREFIAWGAMADAESLTGRSTRAYPVYEAATDKVYFLKDTWRAQDLMKESEILCTLNAAGVRNVPMFVCGDDIMGDVTIIDSYAQDAEKSDIDITWRRGRQFDRIVRRYHHRFVEDFVGKHLDQFSSSKQMMQVTFDAFIAHKDAYVKCGILHRDVSGKNVLMGADGRGILNDWDLAKAEKDIMLGGRHHERTGTWQFMSTLLLLQRQKMHQLQDDLESFVHVVLYHGLRYLNHGEVSQLRIIMERVFDDYILHPGGYVTGGLGKQSMFVNDAFLGPNFEFINNSSLTDWINYAMWAVKQWQAYANPPVQRKIPFHIKAEQALHRSEEVILEFADHSGMERAFQEVLSQEWPSGDRAVDKLLNPPRSSQQKRIRPDEENDHEGNLMKRSRNEESIGNSLHRSSARSFS